MQITDEYIEVNGHKIYVNENLREPILREHREKGNDSSISQFTGLQGIPGLILAAGLPDFHAGYAFPIGSIAAVDLKHPDAGVSPEGVGFDINCGVRCLKTNLFRKDIEGKVEELADLLFREVPAGNEKSRYPVTLEEINGVLDGGMKYLSTVGKVPEEDLEYTESRGHLVGDSRIISQCAKGKGMNQLGSLGSGNHYLEIQVVDKIVDERIASVIGIEEGQILVSIHTGSRGLGHECCSEILEEVKKGMAKGDKKEQFKEIGKKLEDTEEMKELRETGDKGSIRNKYEVAFKDIKTKKKGDPGVVKSVPYHSEIGKKYISVMFSASNFAWANRSIITLRTREAFSKIFPDSELRMVYDVCHNIAKIEEFDEDGESKKVLVHRKGASRALPPGHRELPEKYKEIGQPVLVGGSMGTSSYLIVGGEGSIKTFHSTCHGAGRIVTRSASKKTFNYKDVVEDMNKKGIVFRSGSEEGMVEESCGCYKDVDEVVEHSQRVGLTRTVAKLKPVLVIKN